MIAAIKGVEKTLGPQVKPYANTLITDIKNQEAAVKSGNKQAMGHTVEKGARDTKDGSPAVEANPKLFKLANKDAPAKLEELGAEMVMGTATPTDENKLLGEFNTKVRQYTHQPAQ